MESDPSRLDQFGFQYHQPAEYFWQPEWMTWAVVGIIVVSAGVIIFLPWLKGFRTWLFAGLSTGGLAVLPLLYEWTGYLKALDWTSYVPAKYVPWVVLALNMMFFLLRYLTTAKVPSLPAPPKALTDS